MSPALPRIIQVASGREWRGGQRQVLLLARGLPREQFDQLVVTAKGSRLHSSFKRAGIACRAVVWRGGVSAPALLAAWSEARRGPAILHAHDAHALIVAGIAARLTSAPLLVTRRVEFPIRRPGFWSRADRIIAISAAVKTSLIKSAIPVDRIVVVPSGIDLAACRAIRPGSVRAELRLPASGPLAVSVAALTAEKDHATLLQAAAILARNGARIHWALAGDGPLRPALEQLARDLDVTPLIHFVGALVDPLPLIKSADVLVSSSTSEGLGTSVLDAMALGTPVVATRIGGVPEMLVDGAGLLVAPSQPAALAEAVTQVLADQSLRQSLTEKASREVARFDASGMVAEVARVYRSIVLER